jgi:hypothetical protein
MGVAGKSEKKICTKFLKTKKILFFLEINKSHQTEREKNSKIFPGKIVGKKHKNIFADSRWNF